MADEDAGAVAIAEPGAAEQGAGDAGDGVARLLESFDGFKTEVSSQLGDVTSRLERYEQQRVAEEEGEGEEDAGLATPAFSHDDFDGSGQLTQEAANRALQEIIDQRVEERLAPEREARRQERTAGEAEALEKRYPELADEKVQKAMIDRSLAAAREMGDERLGVEPRFLEMVYLAEKAGERAEQGSSAGVDREAHLEAASGAGGTDAPAEEDLGDRLVQLAAKKKLF